MGGGHNASFISIKTSALHSGLCAITLRVTHLEPSDSLRSRLVLAHPSRGSSGVEPIAQGPDASSVIGKPSLTASSQVAAHRALMLQTPCRSRSPFASLREEVCAYGSTAYPSDLSWSWSWKRKTVSPSIYDRDSQTRPSAGLSVSFCNGFPHRDAGVRPGRCFAVPCHPCLSRTLHSAPVAGPASRLFPYVPTAGSPGGSLMRRLVSVFIKVQLKAGRKYASS